MEMKNYGLKKNPFWGSKGGMKKKQWLFWKKLGNREGSLLMQQSM